MQKIVMSVWCLLTTIFLCGMEPAEQITPYFSQGDKILEAVLLNKKPQNVIEAREIILPIALSSTQLYKIFDNRWVMQNMIAQCALISGECRGTIAKKLKMRRAENYIRFNNRLYVQTIAPYIDERARKEISFLFAVKADPHFSVPGFGTTFLMRAVHLNSLWFVERLLKERVKVNVLNDKKRSARSFNLLYNLYKLESIIDSIVRYTLKLEKHRALNFQEPFDFTYEPFAEADKKELLKAIYIDKTLEDVRAKPIYDTAHNPILIMLAKKDGVREVLRGLYGYNNAIIKAYAPEWIYRFLYIIPCKLPDF